MKIHIEKGNRNIVMEYDKSVVLGIGKVVNEDVVECIADGEFDAADVAELLDALMEAAGEDVFCEGLQMLSDMINEKERA